MFCFSFCEFGPGIDVKTDGAAGSLTAIVEFRRQIHATKRNADKIIIIPIKLPFAGKNCLKPILTIISICKVDSVSL